MLFSLQVLSSQSQIIVASEEWEDCTNVDGTGLYWDILELVYPNHEIKHKLVPYSRSVFLVQNKKADLFVASYYKEAEGVLYPDKDLFFDADKVVAVYKKGTEFKGKKSLSGKKVAWIRGYSFDQYFAEKMKKYPLNKRTSAFNMLRYGRIDFFLDALVEMENMKSTLLEGLEYKIIKKLYLYFAFADNEKGKKLLKIYEKNMKKALRSGEIKRKFEKWQFDYLW